MCERSADPLSSLRAAAQLMPGLLLLKSRATSFWRLNLRVTWCARPRASSLYPCTMHAGWDAELHQQVNQGVQAPHACIWPHPPTLQSIHPTQTPIPNPRHPRPTNRDFDNLLDLLDLRRLLPLLTQVDVLELLGGHNSRWAHMNACVGGCVYTCTDGGGNAP